MANRSGRRLPSLRLHRPSGQAVVRLVNRDGQRRDYYLGKHSSCEAQERYQQLLARWIDGDRTLPLPPTQTVERLYGPLRSSRRPNWTGRAPTTCSPKATNGSARVPRPTRTSP
jgi:hypothetical protein